MLSTEVARKVAVDLLEGDAAKEQVLLLEKKAATLDSVTVVQQEQILLQGEQFKAQSDLLELYKVQAAQNSQDLEQLTKSLQRASTRGTIFATTTGISIVALVCALVFGGK